MQIPKVSTWVERLNRGAMAPLVLCASGIALAVGSWSATRENTYFGSPLFSPAVPAIMACTALVLAIAFRKSRPRSSTFPAVALIAAVVLILVQLAAIPLVPLLSGPELFSLGAIATVAEGVSSALLTFLFLIGLTNRTPRQIAVTVAAGYLAVHLYDGLFIGASAQVRLLQRPVALVAMALLAGVLYTAYAGARTQSVGDGQPTRAVLPREGQSMGVGSCVLLACFVCIPLLIQGVYSQLTGLGGAGNQEFNLFTELFAAGARAIVLVYCLFQNDDLPPSHIAVCAALACLVGIPAVDLSWGTDAYLVGSHIINSMRYILLPVVMISGVQMARRSPGKETFFIFLMMAAANSCYVSRLATMGVVEAFSVNPAAALPKVSLYAMWVVACAIPTYLLLKQRHCAQRAGTATSSDAPSATDASAAPIETTDPAFIREMQFYRQFERLCDRAQLTEREREILREALHGYSVNGIAGHLDLSPSTVKTYLGRAYGRFDVNSKQEFLNLLDSEIGHEDEPDRSL